MSERILSVREYIRVDYQTNRWRFVLEMIGLVCSIAASAFLALTIPNTDMFYCYVLWLIASMCLFVASVSRGSTGFACIYVLFLIFDGIGMVRWITQ